MTNVMKKIQRCDYVYHKKYIMTKPDVCRVGFRFDGNKALRADKFYLAG
jgi:hypothetical protein